MGVAQYGGNKGITFITEGNCAWIEYSGHRANLYSHFLLLLLSFVVIFFFFAHQSLSPSVVSCGESWLRASRYRRAELQHVLCSLYALAEAIQVWSKSAMSMPSLKIVICSCDESSGIWSLDGWLCWSVCRLSGHQLSSSSDCSSRSCRTS